MTTITASKTKIISAGIILIVAGFLLAGVTFAATSVKFEAESATNLSTCAKKINSSTASAGQALEFDCPEPEPEPGGFVHPGVVYTKAEIDSWSTSSPEYSRLAGTCASTVIPTAGSSCYDRNIPVVFGTSIDSGSDIRDDNNEMNRGFAVQSGFAKIQAVLWAADNNNARRNKVISYLEQYRSVTSYQYEPVQQWRLVSGWSCTNLAQAAEIINYQDNEFKRFLRDVCYSIMDWYAGPNWHASFADSKLAIAAYLGDEELWADAKAYFYERIKQSIYHSKYDGNKVNPLHKEDNVITNADGTKSVLPRIHTSTGVASYNPTAQNWGSNVGPTQINSDYTINTADYGPAVDGMNGERNRDLGHVNMSYGAWVNAARTIRAQGEQLEQHAYDRILAGWGYHASRVLAYLQTGTVPAPAPLQSEEGGAQFRQGFFPARTFLGSDTPQSIHNSLLRTEIKDFPAGGTLHMVGEAFTDGP